MRALTPEVVGAIWAAAGSVPGPQPPRRRWIPKETGFGTVVALGTIIRPTQLLIDSDGMTLVQPWHCRRYDFKDCGEFRTWRGYHAEMVVFDHRSPDGDARPLSILNEQVSGSNSRLPNTFGVSAPDMAALLNARRQRIIDRLAH